MSIIVKPINGMFVKNLDFITKMDPYCIIKIGNQKHKSKVHKGGGKNPQWSDTFQFQATGDRLLTIQAYDWDPLHDDFIGEGSYDLSQLYNNPMRTQNQYIDLFKHGRSAGRVLVSLQYNGPSKMGYQQQPMYSQQQPVYGQQYQKQPVNIPQQQPIYNPEQQPIYNKGYINQPTKQMVNPYQSQGYGNKPPQTNQNFGYPSSFGYQQNYSPNQEWQKK